MNRGYEDAFSALGEASVAGDDQEVWRHAEGQGHDVELGEQNQYLLSRLQLLLRSLGGRGYVRILKVLSFPRLCRGHHPHLSMKEELN